MFINAEPRHVSNGFETFVPSQRAESLHQRLVEMTNNDVNAWSVYRPAARSTADTWDQHFDDFGNNENFLVQALYGGYFPNATPCSQNQVADLPETVSYAVPQGQSHRNKRSVACQDSTSTMNCFEQPSPMLGHDYSQWSLGRGRGSFAEFSSTQRVFKDFAYQPSSEPASNTFMSAASSGISTSPYSEEAALGSTVDINRTSPDTVYSNYSPKTTPASSQMSTSFPLQNVQQLEAKTNWWPGSTKGTRDQIQFSYDLSTSYDGLPRYQAEQQAQQCSNLWSMTSNVPNKWALQPTDSTTISPKALTLNVSSASLASSGSSQGSMMALSEASTTSSLADSVGEPSMSENLPVVESPPVCRPRQILPDSGSSSRRIVPVLPSNDVTTSRNTRKRSVKAVEPVPHARRSSPPYRLASSSTSRAQRSKEDHPRSSVPKRIEPKPVEQVTQSWSKIGHSSPTVQAAHHRDAKDDFLVRSKLAGMSYKEIRRQGKFTEAESTLRGRFRTLTKHKAARVRKPEWNDNDIRLLKKAVRKLTHGDPMKSKVPWKQVAEYIANNGGSYHFGNATCRKRWDELHEASG
ncbi:uncharacterized protein PAC_16102 [Phialocephala subalpina]|uniref:Myb-like domain-containing protein n=1 Tax=Phialocephala subalpina TaxID=576137 RepID=A0A1L7XMB6_9HELO|nr:uncharacterized protein PAC_16102 [Phialocephala subalpina]